jgi:hypothetical protein
LNALSRVKFVDQQVIDNWLRWQNAETLEPGGDVGEGEAEPGRPEARAYQSEDIPGWESDHSASDHSAANNDRKTASGNGDTPDEAEHRIEAIR